MKTKTYITTPIYYVNGAPHIGHAYTSIAADVLARFKRLDGHDVFFLTGTDEHGQKVEQAAAEAGLDPQAYTDRISADFRDVADKMAISYDDFIRTTEPRHKVSCTELWRRIDAAGQIYLGDYEGWYAVRDEAFYDEAELNTLADGTKLAPSGAPVAWVREPSYFFRLSAFRDKLLQLYEEQPDFIAPQSSRNEVMSFVRAGLNDLSISRTSFSWGIPVPGAPGHVMYVWLDALNNYVTACGFPDETAPRWRFWPADVHVVGKEIMRFHAVIWPALLMAAGLALPRRVSANGWWTVEGEKMSKSLGNVIEARELAAKYGLDQVRYFLLREKPFGGDGSIRFQSLATRINVELANDLGQSGAAHADPDRAQLRRKAAGAAGADRGRCRAPRGGGGAARPPARAARPAGVPRGAGGGLEGDPRGQRLYRPAGALGAAQDRPRPDERGAARARGHASKHRHRAAAVHARLHGADARSARRAGGRAHDRRAGDAAPRGNRAAATRRGLPALCGKRGVGR